MSLFHGHNDSLLDGLCTDCDTGEQKLYSGEVVIRNLVHAVLYENRHCVAAALPNPVILVILSLSRRPKFLGQIACGTTFQVSPYQCSFLVVITHRNAVFSYA
jgi:hypothetical protein